MSKYANKPNPPGKKKLPWEIRRNATVTMTTLRWFPSTREAAVSFDNSRQGTASSLPLSYTRAPIPLSSPKFV